MFLRESVQLCPQCEELTPHSDRVVVLPKLLVGSLLIFAAWCFFQDVFAWVAGGLLLGLALFVHLSSREKSLEIRCERCRGKKLLAVRRAKPTLDGNTEINIL